MNPEPDLFVWKKWSLAKRLRKLIAYAGLGLFNVLALWWLAVTKHDPGFAIASSFTAFCFLYTYIDFVVPMVNGDHPHDRE